MLGPGLGLRGIEGILQNSIIYENIARICYNEVECSYNIQ